MFHLFRRRGRSSKKEKQTKNVAKPDESTAKPLGREEELKSSPQQTNVESQTHGASAFGPKVNLDSTRRLKENSQKSFVNYLQCADGVVVSETSANSRYEGADLLSRRRKNNSHDDHSGDQSKNSDKPTKQPKTKPQASNRRSIFFRHFQSTPTPRETRYQQLNENQGDSFNEPTEQVVEATAPTPLATTTKASKRFNPIDKGRELFNEILMAKGRHRNNRSHHHKGGASSVGGVIANTQKDSKKPPVEVIDFSKNTVPEPSAGQHTYQISKKSKNTHNWRTTDGAAAAALTPVASVVNQTVSEECADSSVKNNPTTAQSLHDHQNERITSATIADATIDESSCDDQTVGECASLQVQRENAPEVKNIGEEPSEEGVDLESDRNKSSANVEELGYLNKPNNLSELTECDRDRFIGEFNKDMGQSQAKSEKTTSRAESRSSSPMVREFRGPYVEQQEKQQSPSPPPPQAPPQEAAPPLIVPTIVVEDFGNVGGSPSEKEDIFYDVESNRNNLDSNQDKIEDHLLKVPEDDDDDDDDDDDEFEDDQWHFVNNLPESDDRPAHDDGDAPNYNKTENSSDSNLSRSDSGIAASDPIIKVLHLDSCDLVNDSGKESSPHFFRDGSSTDCDENLPHCDDFDYFKDLPTIIDSVEVVTEDHDNHSGILIESISLPDVVVETTTAHQAGNSVLKNPTSDSVNNVDHHLAGNVRSSNNESDNIDNSSSVKMGNTHFIPIRVEKRRSVDDSVLMTKSANGGNSLYNGQQYNEEKPTLEITVEDELEPEEPPASKEEQHKRDLVDQESRFSTQLDDAQKNIYNLQSKVNELQSKIDDLEKELSDKSWNVDRLQGELGAARKEDECVRQRLRLLEDEKTTLRQKYFETEGELNNKYDDLDRQFKELEEKYKQMQLLASNLQTQLACAQSEADQCRQETETLRQEKAEQVRILEEALTIAKVEQEAMQSKWHKEFETLRTQNADREEHLMSDCEWQMRQMQKSCKEKIDKAEHLRKEAIDKNLEVEEEAEKKLHQVLHLKSYEAEVTQLRGLTVEQENSISTMRDQIESLKADLITANENLEEQIECVRRIKYQCDNAIYDKERRMLQRIDEVRHEAAVRWENKLITEMTRLKMELESVYVDERREELDRLQAEHIEELKALTTRYTANEEELRAELSELRQSLQKRNEEFMALREKSDNAILQTRMHLDRADRDYQTAMCREEEKRENLVESLRKEFDDEKLEMEEKFRERLGQVQDEFNKELQISSQEMVDKHRKEMEQQRKRLIAEKEEAIQELEVRHRKKLEDAEQRIDDIETRHRHDLADLKNLYDSEKISLDKRDINNAQEIEQLHRKCRCLTNLFEEMRMRYERRDPRQEDLREIGELRSRCEAQERDICELTERLREMQIQLEELQQNAGGNKKKSPVRKPSPKTIPTNCDVIYEENEERESPPPPPPRPMTSPNGHLEEENKEEDNESDEEEDEDEDDEEEEEEEDSESTSYQTDTINDDDRVGNDKAKSFLNDTIANKNQTII